MVSFVDATFGGVSWRTASLYLPAQVLGCIGGAMVANLMFSKAVVSISTHHRATPAHFLSEAVATLGLILVIFALARSGRSRSAPAAIAAYIGAAYFFTSSTSFANPAITVAECSPTPLPASRHRRSPASSLPRSWGRRRHRRDQGALSGHDQGEAEQIVVPHDIANPPRVGEPA